MSNISKECLVSRKRYGRVSASVANSCCKTCSKSDLITFICIFHNNALFFLVCSTKTKLPKTAFSPPSASLEKKSPCFQSTFSSVLSRDCTRWSIRVNLNHQLKNTILFFRWGFKVKFLVNLKIFSLDFCRCISSDTLSLFRSKDPAPLKSPSWNHSKTIPKTDSRNKSPSLNLRVSLENLGSKPLLVGITFAKRSH